MPKKEEVQKVEPKEESIEVIEVMDEEVDDEIENIKKSIGLKMDSPTINLNKSVELLSNKNG